MNIKPEVLAPAGDYECLRAAILYGANAVYVGAKQFGMRASPKNFSEIELLFAVEYCHNKNVKIYLTCNILPTNAEADELPKFILNAYRIGVDAIIVADIGILMLAKRIAPNLEVHISTQAGVVNYLTANELYNLGAKRVVLAREMPLKEIAILRAKTPPQLEIEAFVHGAMCMSFSGRCLISQYLVKRDANRGECAQPCRWGYHLMEEKRDGQFFPVFEDEKGSYILNAQDLSMLPHLDKMFNAGITSFKIEGRAKSAYYVSTITGAYRQATDLLMQNPQEYLPPEWLLEETLKVSHRKYSTGFYIDGEVPDQYYESSGYVREWEVVAFVDFYRDGMIYCTELNRFAVGEELEIMHPKGRPTTLRVDAIFDEFNISQNIARHPMDLYKIPHSQPVEKGAMLRRKM